MYQFLYLTRGHPSCKATFLGGCLTIGVPLYNHMQFYNPVELHHSRHNHTLLHHYNTNRSSCTTLPAYPASPPGFCSAHRILQSISICRSFHIFICRMLGPWFSRTYFCFSRSPFPRFSCSWIFLEYCSL